MDQSLLKADIFFFVSTIAVVVLTVLLIIGMVYILGILRTIKQISRTAKTGAETIVEGIEEAKDEMRKDDYVPSAVVDIFKKLFNKSNKRKKH
jgi:competence protein ComGC